MSNTLRSADGRVIVPERMRHRRVAVRRDRGRRRLHRLVALGVLVGILGVAWLLLRSPLLAVNTIKISGSSHLSNAQVMAYAGVHSGVAMMDASPGTLERRLIRAPWVDHARVERHWPHEIVIHVSDRVPVAQVRAGSRYALVDASARVLALADHQRTDLPLLKGPKAGAPGTNLRNASDEIVLAATLPKPLASHVGAIESGKDGTLVLRLVGGGVVRLGPAQDLDEKFVAMTTMLHHLGTLKSGCTLDVAVPTAPLVSPEYDCV